VPHSGRLNLARRFNAGKLLVEFFRRVATVESLSQTSLRDVHVFAKPVPALKRRAKLKATLRVERT
jgi:hypothetical protein